MEDYARDVVIAGRRKKMTNRATDPSVQAQVIGAMMDKKINCDWIYIPFSSHHGWEAPEYQCSVCHEIIKTDEKLPVRKCSKGFSPSINGETTQEVRMWFQKELPGVWEKYIHAISISDELFDKEAYPHTVAVNFVLSIDKFTQWILDHYREFMYEECPNADKHMYPVGDKQMIQTIGVQSVYCDCRNGQRPVPRFNKARGIIEEEEEINGKNE